MISTVEAKITFCGSSRKPSTHQTDPPFARCNSDCVEDKFSGCIEFNYRREHRQNPTRGDLRARSEAIMLLSCAINAKAWLM